MSAWSIPLTSGPFRRQPTLLGYAALCAISASAFSLVLRLALGLQALPELALRRVVQMLPVPLSSARLHDACGPIAGSRPIEGGTGYRHVLTTQKIISRRKATTYLVLTVCPRKGHSLQERLVSTLSTCTLPMYNLIYS